MSDEQKQPVFRYGWLFSVITTIFMSIWFAASQNAHLDDLIHRVDNLEKQVYELNHLTRGIRDTAN